MDLGHFQNKRLIYDSWLDIIDMMVVCYFIILLYLYYFIILLYYFLFVSYLFLIVKNIG